MKNIFEPKTELLKNYINFMWKIVKFHQKI